MKKLIISITVIFIFSLTLAGSAFSKEQEICPVLGNKINKTIYADYDGKRVYFCCNMCIDTFKKDPAKYIKKLEDEGVSLATAAPQKKQMKAQEGHNH